LSSANCAEAFAWGKNAKANAKGKTVHDGTGGWEFLSGVLGGALIKLTDGSFCFTAPPVMALRG
jgi:hypothetical protein